MYVSTIKDTIYVDGIDIKSLPGIIVKDIDYFAPSKKRGQNETIPGRQGQLGIAKPIDAYSFSAEVVVMPGMGSTVEARRGAMVQNLRGMGRQLQGFNAGGQVTLKRRLTTGDGVYETTFCRGEYVDSTAISLLNYITGKTELEFINLDGVWYSEEYKSLTGLPGTKQVDGDFATRDIKLTLPGPGTLTNVTANVSLTTTVGVSVDVLDFKITATGPTNQGKAVRDLTSSGDKFYFVLVPGANQITWTGSGSPTITYRSAHI